MSLEVFRGALRCWEVFQGCSEVSICVWCFKVCRSVLGVSRGVKRC